MFYEFPMPRCGSSPLDLRPLNRLAALDSVVAAAADLPVAAMPQQAVDSVVVEMRLRAAGPADVVAVAADVVGLQPPCPKVWT